MSPSERVNSHLSNLRPPAELVLRLASSERIFTWHSTLLLPLVAPSDESPSNPMDSKKSSENTKAQKADEVELTADNLTVTSFRAPLLVLLLVADRPTDSWPVFDPCERSM